MSIQEEMERRRQEQAELVRLKQVRQGQLSADTYDDEDDPLHRHDEQDNRTKWQNFWFYHKWHVVVGIAIVAVVTFLMVDLLTKEKYDAIVVLGLTDATLTEEAQNQLEKELEELYGDADGNGEVNVLLDSLMFSTDPASYQYTMAAQARLVTNLSVTESIIFILDEETFKANFGEIQYGFADLDKLYPDNPFVKKKQYYLKDTKFLKDAGIELKKDLFVIMRYFDADAEGVTEEQKAKFEAEKAVMDQLIAIG